MFTNYTNQIQNQWVLSMAETVRSSTILELAEERLQLLNLLSSESSPFDQIKGDDTDENQDGSVAKILEDQKRLEQEYEKLLKARSSKKDRNKKLVNGIAKKKRSTTAREEQQLYKVSSQLRETTLLLCRHLKENPNPADNWQKIQDERIELQSTLEKCVRELASNYMDANLEEDESEQQIEEIGRASCRERV